MTYQPELSFVIHRNHYLFSDYYLDHRVAERREWREFDARPAFDALSQLWQARRSALINANESQTETDWIRPVLELLDHFYTTQVPLATPQGGKIPDYILCPDDSTRIAVQTIQGTVSEADLKDALAVADAKAWEQPLDRSLPGSGVKTLHQHPALQIDFYIRHSGLAWGVLTNGRLWQLYHKDTSKKLDVYYEVDLPALIEAGDVNAFKYFWLFFRREAFVAGSAAPGAPAWLDLVLAESAAYEQGISESLKEQVYEALRSLAQGFLDFPGNGLTPDAAILKTIHDNSLIVLYRLLFILYAEDRDLLPVRENTTYRQSYSLQALKRRIATEIDSGTPAAPTMSSLWQRLAELWQVIDKGDPFLGVPAYNGGLFKPANHSFLEDYRVGDLHLRSAIDLLARARDPKTGTREVVDYRDLEIRHLGSIYEGLLEYQVRVASEPLVVRKVKGKEVYEAINGSAAVGESSVGEDSPLTPALSPLGRGGQSKADILPGQVYLVTDKGERKATGSYYTPDYIVQYIVEHTVGPVLNEAVAPFVNEDGTLSDPGGLARAVLDVNVLDPAMGSGHFLVAAADYVARFLVEKGAEEKGKEGHGNGESQLAYWRRRVAQACIYGVDLNPLAVELAKLSLWLATVSKNKPLSFLDHHLRCGNSLIGARVADLPLDAADPSTAQKRKTRKAQAEEVAARAAGQTSMLDDSAFAGSMRAASRFMGDIERLGSETLADVHESERIYVETVRQTTQRARRLADLWTAQHFGLTIAADQWPALAKHVLHGGGIVLPGWAETIAQGERIAAERRFLHWELEFPEVFFDQHGRLQGDAAGFDAVIGNPPYVHSGQLSSIKPYLADAHASVYDGTADLYVYFYHQGIRLLRSGGRMSYIVTNKWLRAGYGEALRGFFEASVEVEEIVDFGHAPIFSDADVFPCIVVLKSNADSSTTEDDKLTAICQFPRSALGNVDLDAYIRQNRYFVRSRRFSASPWSLESSETDNLFERLNESGGPLAEFVGNKPYRGLLTGFNRSFLIDSETRNQLITDDPECEKIIRPYLRGQDINRWLPDWASLWIILLRSSDNKLWPWSTVGESAEDVFSATYPSIYRFFSPFADQMEARWDKGRYWWELRSCAYYDLFEQPKIVYQEIQFHPSYCLDNGGYFTNNKAFVLPSSDLYLLAVLNSPLIWWYNWRYLPHMKDEALSPKGELMEQLPIAQPSDEVRAKVEPAAQRLIELTSQRRESTQTMLDWLRLEFEIETPGQKLSEFWTIEKDAFLHEIKHRRPRSSARLTPAALRELQKTYDEYAPRIRDLNAESERLERRLSDLVNEAYGLTPEDVTLMWETAPPRMPVVSWGLTNGPVL